MSDDWVNLADQLGKVSLHDASSPAASTETAPSTPRASPPSGSSGTLGGSMKPACLIEVSSKECLHFIGKSEMNLCLKEKKSGMDNCGTNH